MMLCILLHFKHLKIKLKKIKQILKLILFYKLQLDIYVENTKSALKGGATLKATTNFGRLPFQQNTILISNKIN